MASRETGAVPLTSRGGSVGIKRTCYIIAEAGQNHNGSMKLARQLIDMTAMPVMDKAFNTEFRGVNAIKFTKRDMTEELTRDAYDAPYDSENSYGATYGEHREKLELSYDEHVELFEHAHGKGLDFVETLTSPKTLALLDRIDVRYIKVASRDLTNIPLITEIARTKRPVILSTGMEGERELDRTLDIITGYHTDITILHCISQYPAQYHNLNLLSIPYMKERYPDFTIGYSDHSLGIVAPVVAFALGADVIEKHITVSHSLKGSDHKGALEPDGLWRMARDIRNMEQALGKREKRVPDDILPFRHKLERSLATRNPKRAGDTIEEADLVMLSPGGGLGWDDRNRILGRRLKADIPALTALEEDMVE